MDSKFWKTFVAYVVLSFELQKPLQILERDLTEKAPARFIAACRYEVAIGFGAQCRYAFAYEIYYGGSPNELRERWQDWILGSGGWSTVDTYEG